MVMQVMMTMGPCFWGGRRPSWHPQCSPGSASYSPSWEQGFAWPSPCLLFFIQYKQPPGGAFSVSWPHTHTHTHTSGSQMTLRLLGTPSTPSYVSSGQWSRDAGGQGQEATWLQA